MKIPLFHEPPREFEPSVDVILRRATRSYAVGGSASIAFFADEIEEEDELYDAYSAYRASRYAS